ncbi:MAG: hypothetical protein N3A59_00625 [Thermodesulfovibrionales bacterium]|nr:hypothetical protein [Thermodesulfovibrionales bacterium]
MMISYSGKSFQAIAKDVAEGYIMVNPLFLKSFGEAELKKIFQALTKQQVEIRNEPFPTNDIAKIRYRNLRLQRLHSSLTIIKNYAREKRIQLV